MMGISEEVKVALEFQEEAARATKYNFNELYEYLAH